MTERSTRTLSLLTALSLLLSALILPVLAAPVAENIELETYRGISIGGQLSASTPDGGSVTFEITTAPSKGSVELHPDGSFVYTPGEGRRGRDYFGYRAVDRTGTVSQEATVIIRLLRKTSSLRYEDTAGKSCDYAAHVLAEKGLMRGESIASHALFEPERCISRGEFLALAMCAAGREPLNAVQSTGYNDDGDIARWLKDYVTTALFEGYGREESSFCGSESVSRREAAELVNAVFALTDVPVQEGESQSAANLRECGLWNADADETGTLTRGEAAELLCAAMKLRRRS